MPPNYEKFDTHSVPIFPHAVNLFRLIHKNRHRTAPLCSPRRNEAGVTRQAVSAYSLGVSLPDIDKSEGIADYFEVSTGYLLWRTEVKKWTPRNRLPLSAPSSSTSSRGSLYMTVTVPVVAYY